MDPQAHGYTVVSFHPKSKGIVIYLLSKDGNGKGIVFNINHDIVPQAIGNNLTGESPDKEYARVMRHSTHPHSKRME